MLRTLKPWNSYSLRFLESSLEADYEKSRRKSQEKIYTWYCRICFCLISLLGGYRMIFVKSREKTPELIRVLFLASLLALSPLLKRKASNMNFIPLFISAIFLTNIICELESIKESINMNEIIKGGAFLSGFQIATLQVSIFLFNLQWYKSWLLLVIIQIYVTSRFSSFSKANATLEIFQNICWCLGILFLSALLSYTQELSHRLIFYESSKRGKYLEFFHDLIKNNIPNPMILVNGAKAEEEEDFVVFANKASEELLGTSNKIEFFEKLNLFSFSHIDGGWRKSSNYLDSKERTQLGFRQLLKDQTADGAFKEYQAVLEVRKFNDIQSKIIQRQSKRGFEETIKPRARSLRIKSSKSLSSNRFLPLASAHSPDSSSQGDNSVMISKEIINQENYRGARFFSVKIGNVDWNGSSDVTLFIFQEVTDSISEAHQKARLILARNKNRLLASVSHQLRTPLNHIISSLDSLLPKFSQDKASNRQIKLCWRSTQLLYYSIGNIIDLSKISSKTFSPEISKVPAVALIEEILKLIKFKAKLKKLVFESSFHHLSHFFLVCDQERLKQILLNLLENSIKYTNQGGRVSLTATIEIIKKEVVQKSDVFSENIRCDEGSLKCDSPENKSLCVKFTIEDSGQGIESSKLPKLFELFREVDENPSDIAGGISLGLALSQYLLKKMLPQHLIKEGLIKVQSENGRGSLFSFLIPATDMRNNTDFESTLVSKPKPPIITQPTISSNQFEKTIFSTSPEGKQNKALTIRALIVDDDQINQLVLKNYLTKLGIINVELADNGKEAVDYVIKFASQGTPFDLVLMDCNMPIMNGYEATMKIREKEKAGIIPVLKILAITANVASNDSDHCLEVGMDSYLTKPINKNLFRETLEKQLKLKLFYS